MRPWRLLPVAERELNDAAAFYESAAPGIGDAFLDELRRAVDAVRETPLIGTSIGGGRRRFPFHRFPYSLVYFVEAGAVVVVAIAHHRRRPGYWRRR